MLVAANSAARHKSDLNSACNLVIPLTGCPCPCSAALVGAPIYAPPTPCRRQQELTKSLLSQRSAWHGSYCWASTHSPVPSLSSSSYPAGQCLVVPLSWLIVLVWSQLSCPHKVRMHAACIASSPAACAPARLREKDPGWHLHSRGRGLD